MAMGFNTQLWNINAVENYYGKNSWKTQMIRLRQKEDQFTRRLKPYSKRIDVSLVFLSEICVLILRFILLLNPVFYFF